MEAISKRKGTDPCGPPIRTVWKLLTWPTKVLNTKLLPLESSGKMSKSTIK